MLMPSGDEAQNQSKSIYDLDSPNMGSSVGAQLGGDSRGSHLGFWEQPRLSLVGCYPA